jgi:phage gpG-like protein
MKIEFKCDVNIRNYNVNGFLMKKIGDVMVESIVDNFNRGGITINNQIKTWNQSMQPKHNNYKKTYLVDTGNLRRSIKIQSISKTRVVVGSRLPYANLINSGGIQHITKKQKSFFWAMWYKYRTPMFKHLALKRVNDKMKWKPRKYMDKNDTNMLNEINRTLNNFYR